MQIIITLPEWIEIKGIDNKQFADLLPAYDEMLNMIKNGTPLPKGHGRLIDADDIALIDEQFYVPSDYYVAENAINNAQTIIEADTEESD